MLIVRVAVLLLLAIPAMAAATFFGPTPYLSIADSPFDGVQFSYFHVEDFEDGALNTPGVTASAGVVLPPDGLTDSVDADDGAIDGTGNAGHSWFSNQVTNTFRFTFDRRVLGGLPTHVGIVWTDVGQADIPFFGDVVFEAFDSSGASLGTRTAEDLGDGSTAGGTAEDRFFGVFNRRGIAAIEIRMPSSMDWEVDHLQYGKQTRRGGTADDDEL